MRAHTTWARRSTNPLSPATLTHPRYQQTANCRHFDRTPQATKDANGNVFTALPWKIAKAAGVARSRSRPVPAATIALKKATMRSAAFLQQHGRKCLPPCMNPGHGVRDLLHREV
ncbi:MAG TPA: hypothetical protein VLZ55_12240 [Rhodanobacter sp.]|nr:hypothetical protein [Rhodanobacter sp.]